MTSVLSMKQRTQPSAEKEGNPEVAKISHQQKWKKRKLTRAKDHHYPPKKRKKKYVYMILMCILFPAGKSPKLGSKEKKIVSYPHIGESLDSVTF